MKKKKYKILITWHSLIENIKKYKTLLKKKNISYDILKPKQNFKASVLQKIIHKYDGVICGDDEYNQNVLSKAHKLQVISKWGTGIDSIDLEYAKKNKIKVCNVKDAFTNEVAIYAIGLLIALSRKFFESNYYLSKFQWRQCRGVNLTKKKIGIIGFGKIGQKIACIAQNLDMEVLINDIDKNKKKLAKKLKFRNKTFNSILSQSDFIIFAASLNPTSYHMLNYKNIHFIKKKPILINIARGPIINEDALIYCIKKKIISNIGLDVFNKEPVEKKNKLIETRGNFFSAHNAYNTNESVERTNEIVINNLINNLN
jgi:D-3-phosphoglycerate dehydrogenase